MAITPSEVVNDLRSQIYESDAGFYTDSELLAYMWMAEKELAGRIGGVESESTDTSVASQQEYDRPAGATSIYRVTYDSTPLKRISLNKQNELEFPFYGDSITNGRPTHYYEWGEKIGLYPIPDTSSKTIKYWYDKEPTKLTSSSTTFTLPDYLVKYIADYCLYRMYAKDQDSGMANFFKGVWDENIRKARREFNKRHRRNRTAIPRSSYINPETSIGIV